MFSFKLSMREVGPYLIKKSMRCKVYFDHEVPWALFSSFCSLVSPRWRWWYVANFHWIDSCLPIEGSVRDFMKKLSRSLPVLFWHCFGQLCIEFIRLELAFADLMDRYRKLAATLILSICVDYIYTIHPIITDNPDCLSHQLNYSNMKIKGRIITIWKIWKSEATNWDSSHEWSH